jgi:hypothetical protein
MAREGRDARAMIHRVAATVGLALVLAGCSSLVVEESLVEPQNRKMAVVSSYGDGATPRTRFVLLEDEQGRYQPASLGFNDGPIATVVGGTGALIALSAGAEHAASRGPEVFVTQTR